MTTATFYPAASGDDCWIRSGSAATFDGTSNELRMGDGGTVDYDYKTAIRFPGVTIPAGATVSAAVLKLTGRFTQGAGANPDSKVWGEAADNPAAPTSISDFNGRTLTSASSATWTHSGWTVNTQYTSPSIAAVIQEIVNRGGWASGNALILYWREAVENGWSGVARILGASSYNYSSTTYRPELEVTYTVSTQRLKVWNGSSWAAGALKVWNGSSWVSGATKVWNGSSWV